MKQTKKKAIYIIAAAVILLTAVTIAAVLIFNRNKNDSNIPVDNKSDEYYLNASPTNLLCEECGEVSFQNDFVYFAGDEEITEYDLINQNAAKIKIEPSPYTSYTSLTVFDGNIYAIKTKADEDSDKIFYSIVTIDYNSGKVTEIYAPDDEDTLLKCMTVSNDGIMYFVEGKKEPNNADSDGYDQSFSLMKYDTEKNEKSELLKADSYYIADDSIYFTVLNNGRDAERLFYADINDTENITDTSVDVGVEISKYTPYMYCPVGNKVYYSAGQNKLMYYDLDSKESVDAVEFPQDTSVRFFQYFNDKMIVLLREPLPESYSKGYQYGLYYIDEKNEPQLITSDMKMKEEAGYEYKLENIFYMTIFNGCDDHFLLCTYNASTANRVYLIDKDFNLTKIIETGDWDYSHFEENLKMSYEIANGGLEDGSAEY